MYELINTKQRLEEDLGLLGMMGSWFDLLVHIVQVIHIEWIYHFHFGIIILQM